MLKISPMEVMQKPPGWLGTAAKGSVLASPASNNVTAEPNRGGNVHVSSEHRCRWCPASFLVSQGDVPPHQQAGVAAGAN